MDISLQPGKYVVAVSGGVDSVALLALLHNRNTSFKDGPCKLVVAHFDHGIRLDSSEDKRLVEKLAKAYGLPFVGGTGRLGAGASEAKARTARYRFLEKTRKASGASAVITAHHQDDVLETAIINLLRGTGRRGLTSLGETERIKRPLLDVPKKALLAYARQNGLTWREDSTNLDTSYLRNYVRHKFLPQFSPTARQKLLDIITRTRLTNQQLDEALAEILSTGAYTSELNRGILTSLPHNIAREVLATWLRACGVQSYDRRGLERLIIAAKVAKAGSHLDVKNGAVIRVSGHNLALVDRER